MTQARDEASANFAPSRKPKILLKIAPDLTVDEVADIAFAVRNSGVDGVIVSNTTVQRPSSLIDRKPHAGPMRPLADLYAHIANKVQFGGLSGLPLKPYTLATLRALRPLLPASIPIIGCGGIASGADALEYARAGASAVQLYTSFGYDGVGAPRRIKDELAALLRAQGTTWAAVVHDAVEETSWREPPPPEPVKPEEVTVQQLVAEAEELKRLVDEFSARDALGATKEEELRNPSSEPLALSTVV